MINKELKVVKNICQWTNTYIYANQRIGMRVMATAGDCYVDAEGVVIRRRNFIHRLHIVGNINISQAMLNGWRSRQVLRTILKISTISDI
jgi:hypothetical protein